MKRTPIVRRTPLRKVSQKRAGLLAIYRRMKEARLADLMREHGCLRDELTGERAGALEPHHIYGRGGRLLDFKMITPERHRWIHQHPNAARQKGWLQ